MSQERTVYTKLRCMLLNGEFEPGQRLTEAYVGTLLDASRTPVRAALRRLATQNLVTGQDNCGYSARGITVGDVWDANMVRATLEGLAAGNLAKNGLTDTMYESLDRSVKDYSELTSNVDCSGTFLARHTAINQTFHDTLISATGNQSLARSIDTLAYMPVQISGGIFAADRNLAFQTLRSGLTEHQGVLNAIISGDAVAAEMLMRNHGQTALRGIELIRDRQNIGADFRHMPFHKFINGVGIADAAA